MKKENLEIILEDMRENFDLVLEGHESLRHDIKDLRGEMNEKFELVDFKIEALNKKIDGVDEKLTRKIDGVEERLNLKIDGVEDKLNLKIDGVEERLTRKIDAVAADLAAHRADTESHPKGYKISE